MTRKEKNEAIILGFFLAFLLFFKLFEQQKQESKKIRELRKRVNDTDGQIDLHNLQNDWQKVNSDLKSASKKVLTHA
jgi:hypothetical protein